MYGHYAATPRHLSKCSNCDGRGYYDDELNQQEACLICNGTGLEPTMPLLTWGKGTLIVAAIAIIAMVIGLGAYFWMN